VAENSATEVIFVTIPGRKTIQLLLTLSIFHQSNFYYTITLFHCEGWLGSWLA